MSKSQAAVLIAVLIEVGPSLPVILTVFVALQAVTPMRRCLMSPRASYRTLYA